LSNPLWPFEVLGLSARYNSKFDINRAATALITKGVDRVSLTKPSDALDMNAVHITLENKRPGGNTTINRLSNIVAKSLHSFFSVAGLDNQSIAEPAAGLFPNAASDPLVNRR